MKNRQLYKANAGYYSEEDKQILHFLNGFNMAEKAP